MTNTLPSLINRGESKKCPILNTKSHMVLRPKWIFQFGNNTRKNTKNSIMCNICCGIPMSTIEFGVAPVNTFFFVRHQEAKVKKAREKESKIM